MGQGEPFRRPRSPTTPRQQLKPENWKQPGPQHRKYRTSLRSVISLKKRRSTMRHTPATGSCGRRAAGSTENISGRRPTPHVAKLRFPPPPPPQGPVKLSAGPPLRAQRRGLGDAQDGFGKFMGVPWKQLSAIKLERKPPASEPGRSTTPGPAYHKFQLPQAHANKKKKTNPKGWTSTPARGLIHAPGPTVDRALKAASTISSVQKLPGATLSLAGEGEEPSLFQTSRVSGACVISPRP
jgi:hypothetical protein